MSFAGRRVLALESRRATEIAQLIRLNGGEPFVAPSMREVPLEDNDEAFAFAERLFSGGFDMVILLTGVGTRYLDKVLSTRYPEGSLAEALRQVAVVARGPKPMAVLREWQVPAAVTVPEPNTWRELLVAVADRPEQQVALQEYGKPSPELVAGLIAQGRGVSTVAVYGWALPEDLAPLRAAVQRIAAGEVDIILFTTSIQVLHLLRIAAEMELEAAVRTSLARVMVASIGPTTSETLLEQGIRPSMEPSHPKMGLLVREAALTS